MARHNHGEHMESTRMRNLPRSRRNPWWPRLGVAHCSRLHAALFGLSAALWASPGLAQTTSTATSTSTTAALTTSDFAILLRRADGSTLSTTDAKTYLNQARCQCATPVQVVVQMASASRSKLAGLTATGTKAQLYVGSGCVNLNTAYIPPRPQCQGSELGTPQSLSSLSADGSFAVSTTVAQLFAPLTPAGGCGGTLATTIWLWIDTSGTGYPDSGISGASAPNLGIWLDGTPPPAPVGVVVEGGQQALKLSWTSVSAADSLDLAGYLVFCMRADGLVVFDPGFYATTNNQYYTSQILCPDTALVTPLTSPTSSAAGDTTAVEVAAPAALQNLDPNYLCSGLLPPTQTGVRLGALQNGIPYTVGVAAVDTHGNASPILSGFVQMPTGTGGATGGTSGGLGKSGCDCRLAGVDRSAMPWGVMLALGVASRLRRRGKRQCQCQAALQSKPAILHSGWLSWPGSLTRSSRSRAQDSRAQKP